MKAAFVSVAIGTMLATSSWAQKEIVSGPEAAAVVAVDAKLVDGTVTGTLVNKSQHTVRDVQLMVRHIWYWQNERHPGSDSPGRTDSYTVHEEIPPDGSIPFTYRVSPSLPVRTDGHFKTSVEVVGFTQVG